MISTHWRQPHQPSERDLRLLDILARQAADIIERTQAEEALRRNEVQLKEADRRKDEFLAVLAHELRNPLATMMSAVGILDHVGSADPSAARARRLIHRQTEHVARLLDDLLDVARIGQGQLDLQLDYQHLTDIVRQAVEAERHASEQKRQRLTITAPDGPFVVRCDAARLHQAFRNLVHNAIKYTPPGGAIDIAIGDAGDQWAVSVRDTGVGIPAEKLTAIFGLFTQLDRRPGVTAAGLGIGLSLVKRIVELHGGSVEARSEGPGKGSEFIVRLPVASVGAPDAIRRRASRPAAVTQRVLVVDDNQDAADSLGLVLSHLGAIVHVVHDGPSALQVLPVFRPSLVLLDIGMPGMNGYEVAAAIRQLPGGQHLRLVALTGWGQEEDRRLSAAAGFDHHLIKPTDIDTLQDLLASAPRNRAPGPVEGETASSPS
jgi:signal transduction histidine kinase/ActR/RegA family two-component response regulator